MTRPYRRVYRSDPRRRRGKVIGVKCKRRQRRHRDDSSRRHFTPNHREFTNPEQVQRQEPPLPAQIKLILFNGTAPVGTLVNGISMYSTAGEAYIMDAAGNATLQSPHENENNYWVF